MPELPEVETIRRDLESLLSRETVKAFEVHDLRLMSREKEAHVRKTLTGQMITAFVRKGKYLALEFKNDWRLAIHLRMTGQIKVSDSLPTGARVSIQFQSGKFLSLHDQRRFAEMWLLTPGQSWKTGSALGPDALNELEREQFQSLLKSKTARIQPLLMDQSAIAGIGNIYAQEALFKALIRPARSARRLSAADSDRLFTALQETLALAIRHRGSTSRNYRDAHGQSGTAQSLHAVYRKGGQPCPRCRGTLKSARVGGRGTVFCPKCQK